MSSAYAAKFWGREVSPTAEFTWKSRAPLQCRFFSWLAIKNRCWTSDRLARRGLPHQDACPLCDQLEETIDHILLQCVFARQVWTVMCAGMRAPAWAPTTKVTLVDWCSEKTRGEHSDRDIRTILTLGLWTLWKHRNAIVFDGASPSWRHVLTEIDRESRSWHRAGLIKGNIEPLWVELARWASESIG